MFVIDLLEVVNIQHHQRQRSLFTTTPLHFCLNFFIKIGPIAYTAERIKSVLFFERRGNVLQQALKYIPLDLLVLETDAPYLLPRNLPQKPKSRRNEPAYLPAIGAKVAELLQLDVAAVAHASRANSLRLFGISAHA